MKAGGRLWWQHCPMRTLIASGPLHATASPAAAPGAGRRPRARQALAVLLLVLLLHTLLIQHLVPPGRLGSATALAAAGRPLAVQVRSVPAQALAPDQQAGQQPATAAPAPAWAAARRAPTAAARLATVLPAPGPPAALWPAPVARPGPSAGDARPPATAAAAAAEADAAEADAAGVADTSSPSPSPTPSASASASASAAPAGTAPPVYPTQMPGATTLRYALRLPNQAGMATLAWLHDGQRYQLQLDGRSNTGQPLLEQASQGLLDGNGLAPDRFTDRRRGRAWRAANFRRDVGRISFSGPPVDYPAWPGAQDRLSWLVQLVAIQAAAAATGKPPVPVRLFVVDARGGAALLRFEPSTNPADTGPLQHWQHQPLLADGADRADSQRIDLWLDPALGHWPARLRYTHLRSGDQTEWLHLPGPPQPP